jgi:CheY-like chemotaxis protein
MGFRCLEAKTGEEAVAVCRSDQDIALVLMDIKMPVMDGLEATRLIKSIRPGLPVIAQTAFALETEKAKYSTAFDDYLTKPIKTDDLRRIISLHLTDRANS